MPRTIARHVGSCHHIRPSIVLQPLFTTRIAQKSRPIASITDAMLRSVPPAKVEPKELHKLLRLSALPIPSSREAERKMIETLEAQLEFVKSIQEVDTTGVEPLQIIRDETEEAEAENEINLALLKHELDKEETGGFARRITRRRDPAIEDDEPTSDPLKQATNTVGRFIAVNTKKA